VRLNEDTINSIRNEASITEVIGHFIPLVKKGKGYTAVCPFHDDHDPSLSISEDKKIYKCFVCGNGGNVFSFVENYKKISFPEAVVEVSKIIGKPIEVELDKPKKVSPYQKDYDVLDSMVKYSNYLLLATQGGQAAKAYLEGRGIDEEVIKAFEIGYNPSNNVMYKYLSSKSFKDEDMIKVGITRMMSNGMNDIFYNRVLFPIHDQYGNPVAFSARAPEKDAQSKYINTGETEVYTKGNVIFNYHRVKENMKKSGFVIVVEGVMDVIAYYRAGIYNVVATLGTACSKRQLELLKSLTNNLVLGYDGDNAGINANLKLGERALAEGMNVSVIDNDTELDPDEIIAKYDKNALRDLSGKRISYIDYCLKQYKRNINFDNYSDRKEYHEKMLNIISLLKDPDDIENYFNALTEITKIRKRPNEVNKKEYNDKVIPQYSDSVDGLLRAEYIILSQMMISYKATTIFKKELGCLLDSDNQKLSSAIIDDYRKNDNCQAARLYDSLTDEKLKSLIATLSTSELIPEEFSEEILMGAINKEKIELKKLRLEELKTIISKNDVVDKLASEKALLEYQNIMRELKGSYVK